MARRGRPAPDIGRGDAEAPSGLLWVLPALFAVWANGHAGFVYGLALLGITLLAEGWAWLRSRRPAPRRLLLVSALSAVAVLLTPRALARSAHSLPWAGILPWPMSRSGCPPPCAR